MTATPAICADGMNGANVIFRTAAVSGISTPRVEMSMVTDGCGVCGAEASLPLPAHAHNAATAMSDRARSFMAAWIRRSR